MLDDDGDRINVRCRSLEKVGIIELAHGALGHALVALKLVDQVG
jgi:hypothetical protein